MKTLGVVIGRFQTPVLTDGHKALINQALKENDLVIVLIGTSMAIGTDKNPLDFHTRLGLFAEEYGSTLAFFSLEDCPMSDQDWSDSIDEKAAILEGDVTIYAGRDNSIEGRYLGQHKIKIIDEIENCSATELRHQCAEGRVWSEDFRKGIIYHIENRYPIVYSTVDVAVMGFDAGKQQRTVLMGKKGDGYRFIGGFVDPSDETIHHAAIRELYEETGLKLDDVVNWTYVTSRKVQDERYAGTKDSIMTHLWKVNSVTEKLPDPNNVPDMEFEEFVWMPLDVESRGRIYKGHRALFLTLMSY